MREHHHGSGAFTLPLPDGWRATEEVDTVALVAAAPEDDLGFHRNVVVTVERLADDLDDAGWWRAGQRSVLDELTAPRLIDVGESELAGVAAQRLLIHHLADGHDVALEQWSAPVGAYGWCISTSVAALAYGQHAEELRTIATGLQLHRADEDAP